MFFCSLATCSSNLEAAAPALVRRGGERRLEALEAGLVRALTNHSPNLKSTASDQLSASHVRDVQLVVANEVSEDLQDVAELDRHRRLRVDAAAPDPMAVVGRRVEACGLNNVEELQQ